MERTKSNFKPSIQMVPNSTNVKNFPAESKPNKIVRKKSAKFAEP